MFNSLMCHFTIAYGFSKMSIAFSCYPNGWKFITSLADCSLSLVPKMPQKKKKKHARIFYNAITMSALASWTGLSDNATFQQLNEQNPVFSPAVSMIHSSLPAAGSRPYFIYEESCYTSPRSVENCFQQCSFFLLTPVRSC